VIRLIYRSISIHELLLHEVCEQAGLYVAAGLEVEHADGTGPKWKVASADPAAATVAVGGVVAEWLRGDEGWRVDFVATVRPLMWLVGSSAVPVTSVADLLGRRVAIPGLRDMPTMFLRLLLQRHGHDIATDIEPVEVAHRPDRLRLLQEGEVDVSLLGPEGLSPTASGALPPALYVGDHVEFPTVGLASRPGLDRGEAATLAAVFASAVALMRDDVALGVAAMQAVEPQVSPAVAELVLRGVVREQWQPATWPASGNLGDVPAAAAFLGVAMPPPDAARQFLHDWAADDALG